MVGKGMLGFLPSSMLLETSLACLPYWHSALSDPAPVRDSRFWVDADLTSGATASTV